MNFSHTMILMAIASSISCADTTQAQTLPSSRNRVNIARTRLAANDRTIVPGKRVGNIRANSTPADLVRIFGRKNVQLAKIPAGEGETDIFLPAALIRSQPDKAASVIVIWSDERRNQVLLVRVTDARWRTTAGIRVEMTYPQLRRIIGKFQVSGFGWLFDGVVNYPNRSEYLEIRTGTDQEVPKFALGDGLSIADDDPRWQNTKMKIVQLSVSLGYCKNNFLPSPGDCQ
jgi:hypothetical protein